MAAKSAFKKFKARPSTIQAIFYDSVNKDEVIEALAAIGVKSSYSSKTGRLRIDTPTDGVRFVSPGKYIVKYQDDCIFVDTAENFEEHYVV